MMNTRSLYLILLSIVLGLSISGCDRFGTNAPLPTPWPTDYLPTAIALTSAARPTLPPTATVTDTETPLPTETLEPTATPEPPTLPPLDPTYFAILTVTPPTPTPTPELGRVAIQIDTPGEMSKLVSPIDLRGYVAPNLAGNTTIELVGEDGRTITRLTKQTESFFFQYARLSINVPYEIRSGGELARLQVRTENKNGFVTGLNSVHVLLLSLGVKEVNPSIGTLEVCLLRQPLPNATISGGEVTLAGEMRPYNNAPVIFEVTNAKGTVIGNRVIIFKPADGSYQKFSATIPYSVEQSTSGWLVVRQSDDRIPGMRYVYTQPITLAP